MTTPEIFPDAGDRIEAAYSEIAAFINCATEDLDHAFRGLRTPEWVTPAHLTALTENTHALNEAARHAKNLDVSLRKLSDEALTSLRNCGAITIEQVVHLGAVLSGDATWLQDWRGQHDRTGGQNPAAEVVAEAMRRLFRRLRRPVTFGQTPDGGPSTDFGRAVQFALGAFQLPTDWRNPTRRAREKQRDFENRLRRCAISNQLRTSKQTTTEDPRKKLFTIEYEVDGTERVTVLRLVDRPEIPPLRLGDKKFSSGAELVRFACSWAECFHASTDNTD